MGERGGGGEGENCGGEVDGGCGVGHGADDGCGVFWLGRSGSVGFGGVVVVIVIV